MKLEKEGILDNWMLPKRFRLTCIRDCGISLTAGNPHEL